MYNPPEGCASIPLASKLYPSTIVPIASYGTMTSAKIFIIAMTAASAESVKDWAKITFTAKSVMYAWLSACRGNTSVLNAIWNQIALFAANTCLPLPPRSSLWYVCLLSAFVSSRILTFLYFSHAVTVFITNVTKSISRRHINAQHAVNL